MKFTIKQWTLLELYKNRDKINFPIYQRGEVWFDDKKRLLIDSIFIGLDIPKIYLQKNDGEWDCVDGQQRIRCVWSYFDDEIRDLDGLLFSQRNGAEKQTFENYQITVAEIIEITEEELRTLFLRLQLGLPLNSGEKLNSIKSNLGEFIKKMINRDFIQRVNIPKRRFAKEQVCAQICNNSFYLNKTGAFRNSKYEDLEYLYREHSNFNLDSEEAAGILHVLDVLYEIFGTEAIDIKSRAIIVTVYLLVEEKVINGHVTENFKRDFKQFIFQFLNAIKSEVSLGLDATNRFLLGFQSKVIQGADSKSAITIRNDQLKRAFEYFEETGKIMNS